MRRFLENIFDVFFGTVRRTQYTLVGLFILYCLTHPAFVSSLINLMVEIGVVAVGWIFLRKAFRGSPARKK